MLSYEALTEHAKTRAMPANKLRGVLREYLQVLIMKEIHRRTKGAKLYFTGGTYLRLVHDIKRFSEDLDFNSEKITAREFEIIVNSIRPELQRSGLESEVRFSHRNNIYTAGLLFPGIEGVYRAKSKYSKKEGILIKIETHMPTWDIKKETQVIAGFGETYPIVTTDRSALFADKVDALNKKTRGRHLYDIIYMLSNKFPLDRTVIEELGIRLDPLSLIEERVKSLSLSELKKQAETLRPFLFDEKEAELLINAHQIIPRLIERYRNSALPQ